MDWALAIEKNRMALARVVAEIFALVRIVAGARLPRGVYLAGMRLLAPTESALRRLIFIAARSLVVKPNVARPFPKGLVIKSGGQAKVLFRLFDARKGFDFIEPENPLLVMVKTYSSNPYNPFERHQHRQEEPAASDYSLNLLRRLAAVRQALETLPQQAIRMARWQAKRKLMDKPKFTSPLRPGRPPGYRGEQQSEIDFILQETHGLASDVIRENSS